MHNWFIYLFIQLNWRSSAQETEPTEDSVTYHVSTKKREYPQQNEAGR